MLLSSISTQYELSPPLALFLFLLLPSLLILSLFLLLSGGFSETYAALCDYNGIGCKEEVQWVRKPHMHYVNQL